MDRVAVFVDAGYLFAAGSVLVTGERLTRSAINLDHAAAARELTAFATQVSQLPLLRIYWYDGTSTGPTPQHIALAYQSDIKVRLGIVNRYGEQKGVDSLIVTDLINLARNRAMSDAVLLSGDEDIRVGVQQAQEFGVRVHLLGIEPYRTNQSSYLSQEADTIHEWRKSDVAKFLSKAEHRLVAPHPEDLAKGAEPLAAVAEAVAYQISSEELQAILATASEHQLPREIDRILLIGVSRAIGTELSGEQRQQVRAAFIAACRARSEDEA